MNYLLAGRPVKRRVNGWMVALAALLLGACSGGEPPAASQSPTLEGTPSTAASSPSPSARAVGFEETFRFPDGLTVKVTGVASGQIIGRNLGRLPEREAG